MTILNSVVRLAPQQKLRTNAAWMMAGQGVGVVMQAVYFGLLGRLLGASQYGVFIGAFAFTSVAAQFSTLGSGTIFLRYVSADHSEFDVYWGNLLVVSLGVGSLLVLLLKSIGGYVLNPDSAALVCLAAVSNCVCSQLSIEAGRVFQTFERMRVTAVLNMLTNFLRASTAGVMLVVLHVASAK